MFLLEWVVHGFLLLEDHKDYEVQLPDAIVKFVVIAESKLDKVLVKGNRSPWIKGGKVSVLKLQETAWHRVPLRGSDTWFTTFLMLLYLDAFS